MISDALAEHISLWRPAYDDQLGGEFKLALANVPVFLDGQPSDGGKELQVMISKAFVADLRACRAGVKADQIKVFAKPPVDRVNKNLPWEYTCIGLIPIDAAMYINDAFALLPLHIEISKQQEFFTEPGTVLINLFVQTDQDVRVSSLPENQDISEESDHQACFDFDETWSFCEADAQKFLLLYKDSDGLLQSKEPEFLSCS